MVCPHPPSTVAQCALYLCLCFTLARCAIIFPNDTFLHLDGMSPMSDKTPIVFTRDFLEKRAHISRTVVPGRHRRQVIAGPWYQWGSSVVPFQIWGGDQKFQQLVRNGLRMWEEATCLRFQESTGSRDGIRYVLEKGDACFTEYIGRSGGQQDIVIGSECAEGYVVAHETGHALGFWHTHQRPDREDHITINWKNVRDEAQASFMPFQNMLTAFDIRDINSMRVPYDYGSLMHYHAVAHAKRVSDFTIIPRELKYVTTMGTERMAFLDAKVINDLYCSQTCSQFRRLRCLNGGYMDPNDCSRCRCPDGLGGRDCSQLQPSPCGREIQATDQWQTLESPPGRDVDCYWRIKADGRVRFRLSDGEFPCSYGCQSYVEIKHKRDVRLTGFRSCCYRPKEDTVSDGDQIFVIYRPNGRTSHFTLRFKRN